MSVKRYDIDAYSHFEAANWDLVESEVGDFVYASDYDELRERVKKMIDAYRNAENCSCPYCMKDFEAARKSVEELL